MAETPAEIAADPTPTEVAKALSVADDRQMQCGSPLAARMMRDAAAMIERQAAEIAAKDAEIERLRAGGCARGQRGDSMWCGIAEDMAREVERLRALTTWRPIAEAPKDGTDILLWVGGGMSDPWAQTGLWVDMLATNAWSGWVDTYEGEDLAEPTHWMPRPPPPSVEET